MTHTPVIDLTGATVAPLGLPDRYYKLPGAYAPGNLRTPPCGGRKEAALRLLERDKYEQHSRHGQLRSNQRLHVGEDQPGAAT
jgi:hypothetical protein